MHTLNNNYCTRCWCSRQWRPKCGVL